MIKDGTILTVSYHGAKMVDHDNIINPVKAALKTTECNMAAEPRRRQSRINLMARGPLETRAIFGVGHFDELIENGNRHAPLHRLTIFEKAGAMAACLAPGFARTISGATGYLDGGNHVIGS